MTQPNEDANIEIQDEITDLLVENESGSEEENEELESDDTGSEEENTGDEDPEGGEENPKPKFDKSDPAFVAGRKSMQNAMQVAFDKRIQKMVGQSKQSEIAMRKEFDAKLEAIKADVTPKPKAPLLKDFDSEEEYVEAAIEYKMGSAGTKAKAQPQTTAQQQQTTEQVRFGALESEYVKTHPNYFANLDNLEPFLTKDLLECIYDTTPDVADYLSNNLDITQQISGLRPSLMGRAVAKIEQQFKKSKPGSSRVKKKPAPATEATGVISENQTKNGTQHEYNLRRAKQDGLIR